MLFTIIGFSLLGSVGTVLVAGIFLLFPDRTRHVLLPILLSFATGSLLGAAFLGLLPQALSELPPSHLFPVLVGGILLFFILEKLVVYRHCHDEECEVHRGAGLLILVGDGFHNFVDGAIISGAFLTSYPLGVMTALAIISHEIPQEVGDFAILIQSGYQRLRAFFLNQLSGLGTIVGALSAYFFLKEIHSVLPYLMVIAASSFIYVSTVDLIPALHKRASLGEAVRQIVFILLGIGSVVGMHFLRDHT